MLRSPPRPRAFKDDSAPDQAARDEAIGKFVKFFYAPENYNGWVSMEGFLPACNAAADALSAEDPVMAECLGFLDACKFYPAAKAEWDQVKQGVINVEQSALSGGSIQEGLDALQAQITG